jgi:probable rRNA maturation factor
VAVDIKCQSARWERYERALTRDARSLLRRLGIQRSELSLVLTGDRAMRQLNLRHRGKDAPTDVLSFPQLDTGAMPLLTATRPEQPPLTLGDIVISVTTAERQARALGICPAARIRTLLIHGFLHLMGYDHEGSTTAARLMFDRERELAAFLDSSTAGSQQKRSSSMKFMARDWPPAAMPAASGLARARRPKADSSAGVNAAHRAAHRS